MLKFLEFYFLHTTNSNENPSSLILPQFEGLDSSDEHSRKSLMELNFHLATGDIDAAFNSIRSINNAGVWKSLAPMCAQAKRIDLSNLCFGRMEEAGSAIVLHRITDRDSDETNAICFIDCQLGLVDEAKKLAYANRRFDVLANIHASLSEWDQAIQVCSNQDRIHLKSMSYQAGKAAELLGNYNDAIQHYESAHSIQYELPRLCLQANDISLIFEYVKRKPVKSIHPKIFNLDWTFL